MEQTDKRTLFSIVCEVALGGSSSLAVALDGLLLFFVEMLSLLLSLLTDADGRCRCSPNSSSPRTVFEQPSPNMFCLLFSLRLFFAELLSSTGNCSALTIFGWFSYNCIHYSSPNSSFVNNYFSPNRFWCFDIRRIGVVIRAEFVGLIQCRPARGSCCSNNSSHHSEHRIPSSSVGTVPPAPASPKITKVDGSRSELHNLFFLFWLCTLSLFNFPKWRTSRRFRRL